MSPQTLWTDLDYHDYWYNERQVAMRVIMEGETETWKISEFVEIDPVKSNHRYPEERKREKTNNFKKMSRSDDEGSIRLSSATATSKHTPPPLT